MSPADSCLYPDANVLRNALGEKNPDVLQEKEILLSGLRIEELLDNPISGTIDYAYLKKLHALIFQDIYPEWAGEERSITVTKGEKTLKGGSVRYAPPGSGENSIQKQIESAFDQLNTAELTAQSNKDTKASAFADFLGQIWQAHPFREGNTRTIMLMMHEICRRLDCRLSLTYLHNNHKPFRQSLVAYTQGDRNALHQQVVNMLSEDGKVSTIAWLKSAARLKSGSISLVVVLVTILTFLILSR